MYLLGCERMSQSDRGLLKETPKETFMSQGGSLPKGMEEFPLLAILRSGTLACQRATLAQPWVLDPGIHRVGMLGFLVL